LVVSRRICGTDGAEEQAAAASARAIRPKGPRDIVDIDRGRPGGDRFVSDARRQIAG
jgi:hypothetical protein